MNQESRPLHASTNPARHAKPPQPALSPAEFQAPSQPAGLVPLHSMLFRDRDGCLPAPVPLTAPFSGVHVAGAHRCRRSPSLDTASFSFQERQAADSGSCTSDDTFLAPRLALPP